MLKRHIAFYGEAPRQTAADGGSASRDNLSQAKALGVHDAAFHKKAGLRIMDMGQEQLGLSQAAQLPSRDRIRHLVSEARLWSGALHLARARPLQSIHLVLCRRLQPCPLCAAQADLTLSFRRAIQSLADRRIDQSFEPLRPSRPSKPSQPGNGSNGVASYFLQRHCSPTSANKNISL